MRILQYIAELVQSQREIGIAGLGTIYKKKSPGRYDAATQSFLPPSYTIAFKNEFTDQETLRNKVAIAENIRVDAANEAIADFVESAKKQLSESGRADFSPLGTLINEDGNIQLIVQQDFHAGLEFFGLSKIQAELAKPESQEFNEPEPIMQVEEVNSSEPVEPAEVEPAAEEPLVVEPAAQEPEVIEEDLGEVSEDISEQETFDEPVVPEIKVDPVEEEIVIDNLLEEENPGNETHEPQLIEVQKPPTENSIKYTIQEQPAGKKADPLMLKVALSLLALVVLGSIAYLLYPKPTEVEKKPAVVTVDSASIRADSLRKATDAKTAQDSLKLQDSLNKAKPLAAGAATADTLKKVPADTTQTFEIIGASVLNQKEADWFITQMKRNGIKAKVVKNIPGKRLKMSIATLHDENTAKKERDRLEKKLAIKGIYIYRNKKE